MSPWLGQLALTGAGLFAAGLAAAAALRLAGRDPIACYRLLVATLVAALLLPVLQVLVQGRAAGAASAMLARFRAPAVDAPASAASGPSLAPGSAAWASSSGAPAVAPEAAADTVTAGIDVADPAVAPEAPADAPIPWPAAAAVLWLAGALLVARTVASRLASTRQALQTAAPVSEPTVLRAWSRVAKAARCGDRVRLLASPAVDAPACWGAARPAILVPESWNASAPTENSLTCALLHEAIHLERGDGRVQVLQAVLTLAFWFHPVAWWLSRQLDLWREASCDEEVVRRLGHRRRYAHALLEHAAARTLVPAGVAPCPSLIPWSRSPSQLKRRIEMLIQNRHALPLARRLSALAIAAIALTIVWSGQMAVAATIFPPPPQAPEETPAPSPQDPAPPQEESAQPETVRLGIEIGEVSAALAAQIGHEADQVILVAGVEDGSLAAKAGVKVYDVITHVNGRAPATLDRLEDAKQKSAKGEPIRLQVTRRGRPVPIVIGERRSPTARRTSGPRAAEVQSLEKAAEALARIGERYPVTARQGGEKQGVDNVPDPEITKAISELKDRIRALQGALGRRLEGQGLGGLQEEIDRQLADAQRQGREGAEPAKAQYLKALELAREYGAELPTYEDWLKAIEEARKQGAAAEPLVKQMTKRIQDATQKASAEARQAYERLASGFSEQKWRHSDATDLERARQALEDARRALERARQSLEAQREQEGKEEASENAAPQPPGTTAEKKAPAPKPVPRSAQPWKLAKPAPAPEPVPPVPPAPPPPADPERHLRD